MAQPNASSAATTVRKRELGENTFGAPLFNVPRKTCPKPRLSMRIQNLDDTFRSSRYMYRRTVYQSDRFCSKDQYCPYKH